jgi:hypothetical protein
MPNLDRPVSLVTLANVAALSVFNFARVFQGTTGVAPHRYVLLNRDSPWYPALRRFARTLAPHNRLTTGRNANVTV